ncbi:MAG TPA: sulfite exporter TauE/SafE family protein [Gammaproteobacteria bacterium]|nr:sulfite exporter TauE/SafE family protein [Gammaproteobacteria bacterium]
MTELTFLIALGIGALSTLHCLGMCSGIIGALTVSLPANVQNSRRLMLPYLVSYNLGRITSYVVAGGIVGSLSHSVFSSISPKIGHLILETFSATMLLFIGFHIAGWFPKLIKIETLGRPIWRKLEPVGRSFLPVKSPLNAFFFGLIWGWLPCGLVYSTLLWSATSSSTSQSALLMLGFGLGTLPTTLFAGMLSLWIAKVSRNPNLRQVAGSIIIIVALISLFFTLVPGSHQFLHIG